jgi:MoaA/NifB/PqqE/SkfB family radical SAM enzyme
MSARGSARTLDGVEISPGKLCNCRCVFCTSGFERESARAWAPLRSVVSALARYRRGGAWAVGFVGGEPTAYPGLVGAVVAARRLGYRRIAVCTNGIRLSAGEYAPRLAAAGLTRATVSLHSIDPAVESRLTGVPGVWRRKVAGLRELLRERDAGRLRDGVSLNPVVCRPTLPGLERYVEFFGAVGVSDIRFNFIWPRYKALRDRAFVPSYAEAVPRLLAVGRAARGPALSFGGVPICVLPEKIQRSERAAAPFEEARRDLERETVRATKTRLTAGPWEEPRDHHARVPACARCARRSRCAGPYESYVALYGSEEFRPVHG